MLIKLIDCLPIKGKEDQFAKAQDAWQAMSHCDGLHGQFGGWDNLSSRAFIFALWEAQASIDYFMSTVHDDIAAKNQQHLTYESCSVNYLTISMRIPSFTNQKGLDLSSIGFIRMADCVLFPDGHEQLLADQTAVWNPGMSACKGMLGGFIGKFTEETDRYLVISFWETEADHKNYIENTFPAIRNKVNIYSYIKNLAGHQIVIDKKWNVFPSIHQ